MIRISRLLDIITARDTIHGVVVQTDGSEDFAATGFSALIHGRSEPIRLVAGLNMDVALDVPIPRRTGTSFVL